jgi:serine/threonine protein kinase
MAATKNCPSAALLESLLLGRLPLEDAEHLEAHLAGCTNCTATLCLLPAEDDLVRAVRAARIPPLSPEDTPVVQALSDWLSNQTGSYLKIGSPAAPAQETAPFLSDAAEQTPTGPASVLGPYQILRQLGAGGMGVVYLAFDPRLNRQVALKVIQPRHGNNPTMSRRFQDEAWALAAVESDHIVVVHDVGEDHGTLYLAMPLLRGESLEARLRREGRLPVSEVLRIAREMAQGLAAAHAKGVIHRDIKPSNVWLEAGPGAPSPVAGEDQPRVPSLTTGRVKLLDFGLACMQADLDARSVPSGTPAYMAPEQALGQAVDGRADLFSLGCVIYFMAAGVPPFRSTDVRSTLLRVATEEPSRPRQTNPQLPAAAETLILTLLAKRADDRLASAEAVIQAVRAIEEEAAKKQRRRSRRRWLLATLVGLVAASGLASYLTWKGRSPRPPVTTG